MAGNCMLMVRAGPDADAQGNLALQYFSFDAQLNGGCPGVPAALKGIYIFDPGSGDSGLHGSIGFQGTACKNPRTPSVIAYCYDGTFEVKLDGSVGGGLFEQPLQFDAAVLHLTGRICELSNSTKMCSTPAPPRE
jgi:hypothetical protein